MPETYIMLYANLTLIKTKNRNNKKKNKFSVGTRFLRGSYQVVEPGNLYSNEYCYIQMKMYQE